MSTAGRLVFTAWLVAASVLPARGEARPIAELPPDQDVRFSRDVLPVLKKNCLACHHSGRDEGGVILEDVAAMKDSYALTPGDVEDSRLFVLAAHQDDPVMPPANNGVSAEPLSAMELALIKRWIESGAKVDSMSSEGAPAELQPLPPGLQTSYAATVTPDGRLAAIGFGNQIKLFAGGSTGSAELIETLKRSEDGEPVDPHADFVQALQLSPDQQTLVSAGFRNIQFWKRSSPQPLTLPEAPADSEPADSEPADSAPADQAIAIAVDSTGRFLAKLSPRGELSVAAVGSDRWRWMKSFSVPKDLGQNDSPNVLLAVSRDGDRVAVSWGTSLRVVRIDGKRPAAAEATTPVTAMAWDAGGQLISGDANGAIQVWQIEESLKTSASRSFAESAIFALFVPAGKENTRIAVDRSGKVGRWQPDADAIEVLGQLPDQPVAVAVSESGEQLAITTSSGTLLRFDCNTKETNELASHDPVLRAKHAEAEWRAQVAERLVAAADSELKTTQANQKAEQESLDRLAKDIETKTKDRDEQKKLHEAATATVKAANEKLASEKSKQQNAEKKRGELKSKIAAFDKTIADMEQELAAIKQQKADVEKQLADVPKAETLATAIKSAEEAAAKAKAESENQAEKLAKVEEALAVSRQAKQRGEAKLESLNQLSETRQQALDQLKQDQQSRKQAAEAVEMEWQSSKAAAGSLAFSEKGRLISRSESGRLNLWSNSGQWLGQLASTAADAQWLGGSENLLFKHEDGSLAALALPRTLFTHAATVGDPLGDSPFVDRVLCLDVDPSGRWLASGGGFPSRSGELMIWNVEDQSLFRQVESAHTDTVLAVKFSPDGKQLASAGADRLIRLWDVETGKLIKILEGHTNHVTAIDWHVDGRQLASASADQTIKIWDVASAQASRTISDLKSEVTRLVYVGSEARIGVTTGDGQFRIYRTDNGRREVTASIDGGYLYSLAAERDGASFVVSGSGGTATEVDRKGKLLRKFP